MSELLTRVWAHWVAGGPLLLPIAMVCFGIWVCFLGTRRSLMLAMSESTGLEERLSSLPRSCSLGRFEEDLNGDSGFLSSVMREVVQDIRLGARPEEAFSQQRRTHLAWLGRNIVILAALTAVAPLLGLLGTVIGMVETFGAVSQTSSGTAGAVASGISKALITTQLGLVVAIPGVFGTVRLQRLMEQLRVRLEQCRSHLWMGMEMADPGRGSGEG